VGDPAGGAVEAVGHLVELGDPVPAADRARVTGAEPARRLGKLLHWLGSPPCDDPAKGDRNADRGNEQRHAKEEQRVIAHAHDNEQRHRRHKSGSHGDR
jgi:hypothetical protein